MSPPETSHSASTVPPTSEVDKAVYGLADWDERLAGVNLTKADVNSMVMNYLIFEGYKDASVKFAQETGMPLEADCDLMQMRRRVRDQIHRGNVDKAVELINEINPELLDKDTDLFFRIKQQKLIELIRAEKISEALAFAQDELAPRGAEAPKYLLELERTIGLLIFGRDSHSRTLLDVEKRSHTAAEVNAALVRGENIAKGAV